MSPLAIAKTASSKGLDAIALTDHNSALNCRAFKDACLNIGIFPVFGIEVTTTEEAHILCLFKTVEQAEKLGSIIYDKLPNIMNIPEKFGDQVFVDKNENILGEVDKYLVSACSLSIEELFEITQQLKGIFIPAHIDKPVFSIISQLGFLPQIDYSALETVSLPCPVETNNYKLIQNSDAHYLADIACRFTTYEIESLSYTNLENAIKQKR